MAAKTLISSMKPASPLRKGARPLALFLCAIVSFLAVVFSGGMAVGRWYSAEAVEYSPTLQAIDEESPAISPAPQTALNYHSVLTKPRPTALPLLEVEEKQPVAAASSKKPEPVKPVETEKKLEKKVESHAQEAAEALASKKPVKSAEPKTPAVASTESKKAEPSKDVKKPEAVKVAESKKVEPVKELKKAEPTKTTETKKVELAKTTETKKPEAEVKDETSKTYTLHFGSFPSNKEASNIALKVNKSGQNARVIDLGGSKYQVRLGKFPSLEEAKKAKDGIMAKTGISPVIGTL